MKWWTGFWGILARIGNSFDEDVGGLFAVSLGVFYRVVWVHFGVVFGSILTLSLGDFLAWVLGHSGEDWEQF